VNVDVDECGSAATDEDATSKSSTCNVGVDPTRPEYDRATSNIDTAAKCYDIAATDLISVYVDVDECGGSTIDEDATSLYCASVY
jgi:hypothetical protein